MIRNSADYLLSLWPPWWLRTKSVCLQCRRPGFNPWVGKISRRRKWQPTPVFWKIPWMEEPGRLQFMGSQRVGCDWATSLLFFSAVLYNIVHQETRAHWECYSWKKTLHRDCQLVPSSSVYDQSFWCSPIPVDTFSIWFQNSLTLTIAQWKFR